MVDLLWHLPFAVIDRRNALEIANAKAGEVATITVTVDQHQVPHNPRQPYRIWCSDETGRLSLTYTWTSRPRLSSASSVYAVSRTQE